MENEKYLFVVSGAAGTGKDSVVKALRTAHPEIEKTVSATTRAPRPGEQEGIDYYYRTTEQFQQLIANDEVVEYNFYNGNYYGTLKEEVNKRLAAGKLVVLVIDVHGAANIRRMFPGATTVFLLPPSVEELERRLRGRGTETEDSIRERLATAQNELAQQDNFTLKLVNNEVEACADENANIIYGQIIDEELKDAVRITVIATGFKVGASQSSMDFAPRKDLFASTEPAPQPVQQAPVTFSAPAPTSRFTDEDYIPDFLKRAR